jgi:glycosyltransferase involved in cell wall biosynthesis
MRILYTSLIFRLLKNPALESQLMIQIESLMEKGVEVALFVKMEDYNHIIERYGRNIKIFVGKGNMFKQLLYLLKIIRDNRFNKIYVTNIYDSILVNTLRKVFRLGDVETIFWVQGIVAEESYYRHQSVIRYKILSLLEKLAIYFSHKLVVVSNDMGRFLKEKYKIKNKPIFVLPCVANQKNIQNIKRKKKDNLVFVYMGGMSKWQNFDKIVRFYKNIENQINQTKLLVITYEKEKAKNIIRSIKIKNYELLCLPHSQVPQYLAKADMGFLIRDDNIINRVASPIKLSEYLSLGVQVITTNTIGSYSQLIEEYNCGLVLDWKDDEKKQTDKLIKYIKDNIDNFELKRLNCIKLVRDKFSIDSYIERLIEFYRD